MTGLDQTNPVTYTRPGTWQASVGIAGIDATHTFVDPGPENRVDPSSTAPPIAPGLTGMDGGPDALKDTKAPAMWSRAWWQNRNKSSIQLENSLSQNGGDPYNNTVRQDQTYMLGDSPKVQNPSVVPIPNPRWTGNQGPQNVEYSQHVDDVNRRPTRFVDTGGAAVAFSPSLRPSPMAMGDGRPNIPRFRPTQRVAPVPLDQQIVSQDQTNTNSSGVLSLGGTLSQRWW